MFGLKDSALVNASLQLAAIFNHKPEIDDERKRASFAKCNGRTADYVRKKRENAEICVNVSKNTAVAHIIAYIELKTYRLLTFTVHTKRMN